MNMNMNIKQFTEKMILNPSTTKEILEEVETKLKMKLPAQYVEFMLESNGAEGKVGLNSYLNVWPASDGYR